MPELPEVETIRRGLVKRILHKKIQRVEIRAQKVVKNNPKEFIRALKGNSFVRIDRRGKLLILPILRQGFGGQAPRRYLLIHLKMTGQLIYQSGKVFIAGGHPVPQLAAGLPHKHTHVIIHFSDGSKLFFNDLRKFGVMKVVDKTEKDLALAAYGIEPLSRQFTWENFQKAFRKRQVSLKAVLLNQALIAGLGNIYVDEAAFAARLRPARRVSSLTQAELRRLFLAIPKILQEAIQWKGTTFNHFRDSEGKKGNYSNRLKVYGRAGEKCYRCRGRLVKTVVAQRGTVYCPICQK